MEGVSYLAFIHPVAVVSAAIGAASSAVETLAKDIGSGYFWRLIFTPASRLTIVLGSIYYGNDTASHSDTSANIIGMLLGLKIFSGIVGLLLIVLLGMSIGLSFTGYAAAITLATKSAQQQTWEP
jgi:ABC-2 type transport system permease protein